MSTAVKTEHVIARIPVPLKRALERCAEDNTRCVSHELTHIIKQHVAEHDAENVCAGRRSTRGRRAVFEQS